MSDLQVVHQAEESRWVVEQEGHLARLIYRLEENDTQIRFIHTIVPDALGGKGIGKALALAGLNYAKDNGLGVIPQCPFVKGYIERHPEWQPLVVEGWEPVPGL